LRAVQWPIFLARCVPLLAPASAGSGREAERLAHRSGANDEAITATQVIKTALRASVRNGSLGVPSCWGTLRHRQRRLEGRVKDY
jgi:hypothetical protein